MKPEVMRAAIAAGAAMINDVDALRAPGALEAVRSARRAVCLMHMQGEPRTMQHAPALRRRRRAKSAHFLPSACGAREAAGIARERIVIDPGFGFGKTLEHNLALLRGCSTLVALG